MTSESSTKRRYTRLSEEDWSAITEEWQAGSATLASLADRYGTSIRNLQNRFAEHGVVKGSAHRAELAEALRLNVPATGSASAADTCKKAVRSATFTRILEVEAAIVEQLALMRSDPTLAYRCGSTVKTLVAVVDALGRSYSLKREILELDKVGEEDLPRLTVRDITRAEIHTAQDGDDDEDAALDELVPIEDDDDDSIVSEAA